MDYKKLNAIIYAVLAALFYAINIPFSKLLLNNVAPTFMAAFLYLGAGLGVGIIYVFHAKKESRDERTLPGESICKTVGSNIPYYSGKHNPFIFRRGKFFFFLGLGICSWSNCLLGT